METLNSGTNSFLLKVNLISKETKNIHGLIVRLLRLYNIAEERSLLFSLMKKVTKKYSRVVIVFLVFMNLRFHCLKIKSLKTTSKCRSTARAVRPSSSTRGLLPLYFFVVLLCFLFKGGVRVV
jgi:hypothetical protein